MFKRAWISTLAVLLAATVCLAQETNPSSPPTPSRSRSETPRPTGPLNNDTALNARVLIPDGTSVSDALGEAAEKWYVATIEQGKSYVLEAMDPYGDLGNNCVLLTVYDSDAVTTPPANAQIDPNANTIAPSMEVNFDGARVAIRSSIGSAFALTRVLYFSVIQCATGDTFKIRLREATVYSRWTVNSYNMFVALQNTTTTAVRVQVIYYDDTGANGGSTGDVVTADVVTVPAMGAAQVSHAANSLSPNRGALRVQWSGQGSGLVPGAVNVQTYALNVATGVYLDFLAERVNDGRTGRSW
jgi:hypothetical protein